MWNSTLNLLKWINFPVAGFKDLNFLNTQCSLHNEKNIKTRLKNMDIIITCIFYYILYGQWTSVWGQKGVRDIYSPRLHHTFFVLSRKIIFKEVGKGSKGEIIRSSTCRRGKSFLPTRFEPIWSISFLCPSAASVNARCLLASCVSLPPRSEVAPVVKCQNPKQISPHGFNFIVPNIFK